ncbi:MAG: gamma-glutamyl-gamma-aminobutyrate hydrolase family protein [Caldilineaceae bacterium]|nr:gamma-glutamyl-gamma-aminobutyrate hydrolase family protein [Caldilineaceae bacterium]
MTTTGKPLWIGVTTRHGDAAWVEKNTRNYLAILQEYGATPVILSPDQPTHFPDGTTAEPDPAGRLPAAVLDRLQGLILSGGGDVHPHYFGQELNGAEPESIDLKRDELELTLAQQALARDLPLFAICRGCQVLNVAAGGGMVQHFDGHRSPQDSTAYHPVTIVPESRFHAIVGTMQMPVNTFHHQGLDRASMAPLFVPVALAQPDEWLVEAYESQQHQWVFGVQWHPERVFELSESHRRLWDSFLESCQAQLSEHQA